MLDEAQRILNMASDYLCGQRGAFEGILGLIPAKMYYEQDNSDQWSKKKQTKQQAADARRGKLDPDSERNRNAKEVLDERAKNKRKLREMKKHDDADNEDDWKDHEPVPGVEMEKPGEGLKVKTAETNKKQKRNDATETEAQDTSETNKKQKLNDETEAEVRDTIETSSSKMSKREEKRVAKKEMKKEKKAEKKVNKTETPVAEKKGVPTPTPKAQKKAVKKQKEVEEEEETTAHGDGEVLPMDISGLENEDEATANSSNESEPQSPTFDTNDSTTTPAETTAEPASTTTSTSSTIPPSEKPKSIKLPADTSAIRARLAAKIEALRAARKADGPDGKPIRTRQELIESRRKKQEARKAHKQEMRKQAKLEEQRKREEALASSSPGVMSPAVELDESASNFTFGRVAFGDGAQLSRDLGHVLSQGKKKGPSDPKTALIKVQNQKKRLQELNPEKRADIAEKDIWLTARRRAEGEKIRDDEALLKRAVKRKEAAKKKSEKAWRERSDGVKMAQKDRQRKREDNLRQRRDDKLLGKAGKKKKGGAAGGKKKSRPGFEGSLGVGGKKK
ncbi:RRP14-like protein [Fusarium pseudocircinatum]|uniref:RRP14-like protein n=1 Tax=Fusarium pseudocircinatum TaxID=56676 RepID=A0A8H5L5U8_9HYPO|nr:RRP14-like protein [Fusarium pseudocircinatum]